MKTVRKYITGAVLALAGALSFSASATELLTEWRSFPSADWRSNSNTMRVTQYCPTERYLFVLMQGNTYDKTAWQDFGHDNNAYLNLFYYDNEHPQNGFRPIETLYPECRGMLAACISYNLDKKYLVVTYQDGRIELIYDDGRVAKINDFMDAKLPGSKRVNSISFSPENNEIYLATQNGYVVLDDESASVKEWVRLWTAVNYISRMDDMLVAVAPVMTIVTNGSQAQEVAETTLVTYRMKGESPKSIADFTPVKLSDTSNISKKMVNQKTGNLLISDGVMPLTDKTFITVGRAGDANNSALSIISLTLQSDGSYRPMTLVDTYVIYPADKFIPFSPFSGGINLTADGYCVKSGDYHMIKKGQDPDFTLADPQKDYKAKVLTTHYLTKSGLTYSNGASYDGLNFWVYQLCGANDANGGFCRYIKGGDGKLALADSKLVPSGPAAQLARNLVYAPGYGMIVPGREYTSYLLYSYGAYDSATLFDGKNWKPLGVALTSPAHNSKFVGTFGETVDPDNPKYVYSGSYNKGLLRRNLEDPTDVLHITFGSGYNAAWPADVEIIPGYATSATHSWALASRASFDADGRMWFCSFNSTTMYSGEGVVMFYWDKQDRLASVNKESYKPMKSVRLKTGCNESNKLDFIALAHPKNKNKLVYLNGGFESSAVSVIDHSGTPDNVNDDRYGVGSQGYDPEGRRIFWDYVYFAEEDPVDGRVWLFTGVGLYWFDPEEFIKNPGLIHRFEVSRFEGKDQKTVIGESALPMAYSVDNYNRKWFGFNGGGIICISPDNNEQIAHFNSQNSPLISNAVIGLGWNPERNSLMISTDSGLQEMMVNEGVIRSEEPLVVYPVAVTPGFKGYVTVRAAVDTNEYSIKTADGASVIKLGRPKGGDLQWNLLNAGGTRVAGGKYNLVNETTGKIESEILVVE